MDRRSYLATLAAGTLAVVAGCARSDNGDPTNESNGTDDLGSARVSVSLEHTVGFEAPDSYEVTLEVSEVRLTRANETQTERFQVEQQVDLRVEPGEFPSGEITLVEEQDLPVGTYDRIEIVGEIVESSVPDGVEVVLEEGNRIERVDGIVFEADTHVELQIHIALNDRGDQYVLSDEGSTTITW